MLLFGLIGLAAAVLVLRVSDVSADASALHISDWSGDDAVLLELTFRGGSDVATAPRVRARGWYRRGDESRPRAGLGTYVAADLEPVGGGHFRGSVALPNSAVYAAFVVEDPEGRHVSTNGHRMWEILRDSDAGVPLYTALRHQYRAAESRQSEEALEIARRMTTLYPDEPEGWLIRLFHERFRDPNVPLRRHRAEVRRLDAHLFGADEPAPDQVAGLARYARELGEDEIAGRWWRALEGRAPDHPAAVNARVLAAMREHRSDPHLLVGILENEWWRTSNPGELVAQLGFEAALRMEDVDRLRVWADRYRRTRPDLAWLIADGLRAFEELRGAAEDLVRTRLAALRVASAEDRPPFHDIFAEKRYREREANRYRALLGEILISRGDVGEGIEVLELAAETGWDPSLFRRLAETHLQRGSASKAVRFAARLEADPFEPSPRSWLEGPVDFDLMPSWGEQVRLARREMRRRIVERVDFRPIPRALRLVDGEGRELVLEEAIRESPELLLHCVESSALCTRDLGRLATILESAPEIRAPIRLVVRSPDAIPPLPGESPVSAISFDSDRTLPRTLRDWSTPQYLVMSSSSAWGSGYRSYDEIELAVRALALLLLGE